MIMEQQPDFYYTIDLEERGQFHAHVSRMADDTIVYEIEDNSIFEDGFMRHSKDVAGLERHLKSMDIIPASAALY